MNKVKKNYLYNLSYQILVLIVPLLTTPYISRILGAKGVGIFSYTNSIVQYFILFGCVGLNLYGQREIAYVQHDKYKSNKLFWELVILRTTTISIALILFLLTFVLYSRYSYIFIIMTLDILASMVDISWFFQGIEEFSKVVLRNFLIKIIGVILIFIFVKSSVDLRLYVLCHSVTLFFGNLSLWFYVPKMVQKVPINKCNIRKHIKPTISLFLPQIATAVYGYLDKVMLGFITGIEEEVGFYEQSQKIIKIVLCLVTSLGTVMLPRIANLFKLNEMKKIKEYLSKSFRFVFFFSFPMMFGLMAISDNMVPWFFGTGYDKVILNIVVIAPILVFIALSNITGIQFLLPIGRQKQYATSVAIGCIVNCCLNLLFIPKLLSVGAAIATVIAECLVTVVQMYYTKDDFEFKNMVLFNYKYIVCSIIMFIPTFILARILTPTIFHTVVCIIVGMGIYFGLLILMKDKTLIDVIDKIKTKLKDN